MPRNARPSSSLSWLQAKQVRAAPLLWLCHATPHNWSCFCAGPPRTAESKPQATRLAGGTLRGKQGRTASGLTHRAVAAAARRGAGRGRGGGSPAPPSLPAALSAGASIVAPSTAPSSLSQAVAGGAADKSGGGTGQPSSAAAPPPSKPVQASPQLQQLCGMFPDVPSHLLARVLSRCLHNVTDCVELLLAQEDLKGYCRQVQEEADAAAARAVAAKQAQEEAARAANARVMERFHEVDPNASTATPDIIRTAQGGYMKIRVAKGQKLGKKALKRARKAALASAK